MHIHGRTKIHADSHWSFFESVAVQIGDEILEVKGHQQYWVNGVENATLPAHISGYTYEVTMHTRTSDKQPTTAASPEYRFDIDLGDGEKIFIRTFNELTWVGFEEARQQDFYGADGLLGHYETGQKVARDGKTIVEDANIFGQEWQVRAGANADPKLFYSINNGPQWPQQCNMPDPKAIERRLHLISREDAKKACSVADASEQDSCIFDVQATNNKEIGAAYEYY